LGHLLDNHKKVTILWRK